MTEKHEEFDPKPESHLDSVHTVNSVSNGFCIWFVCFHLKVPSLMFFSVFKGWTSSSQHVSAGFSVCSPFWCLDSWKPNKTELSRKQASCRCLLTETGEQTVNLPSPCCSLCSVPLENTVDTDFKFWVQKLSKVKWNVQFVSSKQV